LCGQNEPLKNKFIELIIFEKQEFVEKNPGLDIDKDKITQYTPLPFNLRKIWGRLCFEDRVTWQEKEQETPAFKDGSEGDYSKLIAPVFNPPATGPNPPFKGGNNLWNKQL
ncbi:hypothetical protein AB4189_26480, partial [Vibrio sp. 10N.286.49.E1]|uniref:hypothetical protein n=1 Tax=Vibrio sp. 10N.286.49.E1 TaxID=3229702 RepID=UPI00355466B9